MSNVRRYLNLMLLVIVCFSTTGCLGIINQLIAIPFQVAGQALNLLGKIPFPPPGMF